jgi:hypothetical protein
MQDGKGVSSTTGRRVVQGEGAQAEAEAQSPFGARSGGESERGGLEAEGEGREAEGSAGSSGVEEGGSGAGAEGRDGSVVIVP